MEIAEGVQWIGIVDPQLRSFFGREFLTPRGTTFNSYLILDERIACIASLRGEHIASLIENIERHVGPVDIDYLVLNQIGLNDGAALRALRRLMPSAQLLIPAYEEVRQTVESIYS
jgi:flavorubredoxin